MCFFILLFPPFSVLFFRFLFTANLFLLFFIFCCLVCCRVKKRGKKWKCHLWVPLKLFKTISFSKRNSFSIKISFEHIKWRKKYDNLCGLLCHKVLRKTRQYFFVVYMQKYQFSEIYAIFWYSIKLYIFILFICVFYIKKLFVLWWQIRKSYCFQTFNFWEKAEIRLFNILVLFINL